MKDQNKRDWKRYEFIAKYIYENLGDQNIAIEGYGNNCKIICNSGIPRQVNVLTSEPMAQKSFDLQLNASI